MMADGPNLVGVRTAAQAQAQAQACRAALVEPAGGVTPEPSKYPGCVGRGLLFRGPRSTHSPLHLRAPAQQPCGLCN